MERYRSKDGAILEQRHGSGIVHVFYPDGSKKTVIGVLTKDTVEAIVLYADQPQGAKRMEKIKK